MSLRYGNGNLNWFEELPREDQARLLAYCVVESEEAEARAARRRGEDPDRDRLLRAAQDGQPVDASEYLRRRAERLARSTR